MLKRLLPLLGLLLAALPAHAQVVNISGGVTRFTSTPTQCPAGQATTGIDAQGNAQNCFVAGGGGGFGPVSTGNANHITVVSGSTAPVLDFPTAISLAGNSLDGVQISGANIATALAAAGANAIVIVPAGSYTITAKIVISNANVFLWIRRGATLTDSALADAMIQIGSGANNVTIYNEGVFDGASTAVNCIQAGPNITGAKLISVGGECKNTTGNALDIRGTAGNVAHDVLKTEVRGWNVHDVGGSAIAERNTNDTLITQNVINNSTLNGISINGVRPIASENTITGWGSGSHAIGDFGTVGAIIRNNRATGTTAVGTSQWCYYIDTSFSAQVIGNTCDHADAGIRVEVSQDTVISDNKMWDLTNTGSQTYTNGILVNSRIDAFVLNALTATTGLTAGSGNVTITADGTDPSPAQTNTVKLALNGSFTTGTIVSSSLGGANAEGTRPLLQFYLKSDTALTSGQLSVKLASDTGWTSFVSVLPLSALPANTWQLVEVYDPEFEFKWSTPGIASWGIVANTTTATVNLRISQLQMIPPYRGAVIKGNSVERPSRDCYRVETFSNAEVSDNLCAMPGFYNSNGTGVGVLLSLGVISGTAGQTMNNVRVHHNVIWTSPQMSTTIQRCMRAQVTSGTGSSVVLEQNSCSGFAASQNLLFDTAMNATFQLNDFSDGAPHDLTLQGLLTLATLGTHFNQSAASGDFMGVITITAATSNTHNFNTNYASAPNCGLLPVGGDPTAVGANWATATTSVLTAHHHTSGTQTYVYICTGAPN